jgi:hypothetical protein
VPFLGLLELRGAAGLLGAAAGAPDVLDRCKGYKKVKKGKKKNKKGKK